MYIFLAGLIKLLKKVYTILETQISTFHILLENSDPYWGILFSSFRGLQPLVALRVLFKAKSEFDGQRMQRRNTTGFMHLDMYH